MSNDRTAPDKAVVKKKRPARAKKKALPPHIDALYKAVQAYVTANGGSILVIGGITIQEWPQDNQYVFHVAVKCCGKLPTMAKAKT
jgi:hypothetical protein